MFNFFDIIKHNRNTFYNYATNEKSSLRNNCFVKVIISCTLSLLCSTPDAEFINATLEIHAILLGFSFNVIFYLLSSTKLHVNETEPSLERKLIIEKINKISDEIFFNVSYFNIVALLVIVVALSFLLVEPMNRNFLININGYENIRMHLAYIQTGMLFIYNAVFYFLVIESLVSFGRNIGRASYYFLRRIELKEFERRP